MPIVIDYAAERARISADAIINRCGNWSQQATNEGRVLSEPASTEAT